MALNQTGLLLDFPANPPQCLHLNPDVLLLQPTTAAHLKARQVAERRDEDATEFHDRRVQTEGLDRFLNDFSLIYIFSLHFVISQQTFVVQITEILRSLLKKLRLSGCSSLSVLL